MKYKVTNKTEAHIHFTGKRRAYRFMPNQTLITEEKPTNEEYFDVEVLKEEKSKANKKVLTKEEE